METIYQNSTWFGLAANWLLPIFYFILNIVGADWLPAISKLAHHEDKMHNGCDSFVLDARSLILLQFILFRLYVSSVVFRSCRTHMFALCSVL